MIVIEDDLLHPAKASHRLQFVDMKKLQSFSLSAHAFSFQLIFVDLLACSSLIILRIEPIENI